MKIKVKFSNLLPHKVMELYRASRTIKRILFRPVSDRKHKRIYLRLLNSKFPDLKPDSTTSSVLDLGANLGHFSAAVRDLGFAVKAVEPHPFAFSYLESRFKHIKDVTLINKAIAGETETVFLQLHPDHSKDPLATSLSASLIESKFHDKHEQIEVGVINFSDFFKNGEHYDLVKIDIEGAEMFLFQQILENAPQIRRLLLETHSRFMGDSAFADEYERQLMQLEAFIASNNLETLWFTDWV
jgi:FkbM family methyltransferase